ncbi:YfiT family bacillithiol transferase [uncultured Roseivirga sp.]|uniref:YfiT family bacillithiol transferase n=1 Tax=uncultured Roseivirga sp. TaxID=543088 RepID=UPI0030DA1ECA|tara:strand:+ start:140214 stop:140747 length:534 start_codon:yes stop_codon:yes gene_type:complete
MTADLRYPIGKFDPPANIAPFDIDGYIKRIKDTPEKLKKAIEGLTEEQLDSPYRPEGWTVRQVIHHVADSHMNAYIRFHWALTEDTPLIKAYDEKAWAELSYQNQLPLVVSLNLIANLHERWVYLLKNMSEEGFNRSYIHPEGDKVYVLSKVAAMYAWHGDHHTAHITSLRERMGWK